MSEVKSINGYPIKDAVAREFIEKFKNSIVNILDFGAIPDGETDCLSSFNEAISDDAVIVYVPNGEYYLSDCIQIDVSNKYLILEPQAHIFTTTATSYGHTVGFGKRIYTDIENPDNYTWIENVGFIGGIISNTSDSNTENGVGGCFGVKNCIIRDVTIQSVTRKGITFQYGYENLRIENNRIINADNHGISIERNYEGARAKNVIITNNVIDECSETGLHASFDDGNISGNIISKAKYGINIIATSNVNVNNNNVKGEYYGILASRGCKNSIISNNIVECYGISNAYGVATYYSSANITNNIIVSEHGGIAHLVESNKLEYNDVVIRNNDITSKVTGVNIICGLKVVIENNVITSTAPYYAINVANVTDILTIIGNTIIDSTLAINLITCTTKPIINSNIVKKCTVWLSCASMGDYLPISIGNKVTFSETAFSGWKPSTSFDELNNLSTLRFQSINVTYGIQPTTTAGYTINDIVLSNNPLTSGYIGWVLTTAGWKGFGALE